MRAVDTNVVVRLLARDDPRQTRAAEEFVAQGAWVSHIVLVETVWVLASVYQLKAPAIATTVEMLLDHRDVTIQDPDVIEAALARFRQAPSISFSDCLVLETARKAGHTPLGTFDRALARADGAERL
ncbi:MAG: type II toxin-antitoxin system VapC family toxin [Vicinamibacteria bacterium]